LRKKIVPPLGMDILSSAAGHRRLALSDRCLAISRSVARPVARLIDYRFDRAKASANAAIDIDCSLTTARCCSPTGRAPPVKRNPSDAACEHSIEQERCD
jgi:hypothetical protein